MGKPLDKIGKQLPIPEIMGIKVFRSDFSSFSARLPDGWKLWFWSSKHSAVATENTSHKYSFKLSNTDISLGKIAAAKILTHGVYLEIPDEGV